MTQVIISFFFVFFEVWLLLVGFFIQISDVLMGYGSCLCFLGFSSKIKISVVRQKKKGRRENEKWESRNRG